jgi:hypothetical protein
MDLSPIPKNMRFGLSLLLALGLAWPLAAQTLAQIEADSIVDFEQSTILETSMLINSFGLNFAGNLQQMLAANGFTGLTTAFRQTANFGGYYRWKRIKVGGTFGFDLPSNDTQKNLRLRTQRYYVAFRVGYGVVNTRNRRFFVNLGVGAMGWESHLYSTGPATISLNWANLRPTNLPSQPSVFLTNTQPVLDASLEWLLRERKAREGRLNYRVGYMFGLRPRTWEADGVSLVDAPSDRFHRVYAEVSFSLVRSRHKNQPFSR